METKNFKNLCTALSEAKLCIMHCLVEEQKKGREAKEQGREYDTQRINDLKTVLVTVSRFADLLNGKEEKKEEEEGISVILVRTPNAKASKE